MSKMTGKMPKKNSHPASVGTTGNTKNSSTGGGSMIPFLPGGSMYKGGKGGSVNKSGSTMGKTDSADKRIPFLPSGSKE